MDRIGLDAAALESYLIWRCINLHLLKYIAGFSVVDFCMDAHHLGF